MSEPQLFTQETIDQVITKLQNGETVSALNQVLSNELVFKLSALKKQAFDYNTQIVFFQTRIDAINAEIDALLNPQPTPEKS